MSQVSPPPLAIEVVLNLSESNDPIKSNVVDLLMFEPKDLYALALTENLLQAIIPGDYKLVTWASMGPDLDVIVQFSSVEEFVLFQMKWR